MPYSALVHVKKTFNTLQQKLSKILTTSDFSSSVINDTKAIISTVKRGLDLIAKQSHFSHLTMVSYVHAMLIHNIELTDDDILINADKDTFMKLKQDALSNDPLPRKKSLDKNIPQTNNTTTPSKKSN